MTFDKQVEQAKKEKLMSRVRRDIVFILLGIIFLIISILLSLNEKNANKTEKDTTKTTTIVNKENK